MRKGYPRGHQRNVKGDKIAYRLVFNRANQDDNRISQYLEPLRSKGEVTATIKAALHAYIDGEQKYDALVTQISELIALVQNGKMAVSAPVHIPTTGKAITLGNIAAPSFDDEDDVVNITQDTQTDVNSNFMDSLGALMGGSGNG